MAFKIFFRGGAGLRPLVEAIVARVCGPEANLKFLLTADIAHTAIPQCGTGPVHQHNVSQTWQKAPRLRHPRRRMATSRRAGMNRRFFGQKSASE